MKYILCLFIISIISNTYIASTISSSLELEKSHSHKYKNNFEPLNINMPDVPVFYQNWAKYYHYLEKPGFDNHIKKPETFFQNNAFFNQNGIKMKEYLSEKDKHGRIFVPSKSDFYVIIYNNTLAIFSQRVDIVRHQVDSFKITDMANIPEDKYLEGGVKDLGEYKAGHCAEITVNSPKDNQIWIICLNNAKEKQRLMKTLIKIKLKEQRKNGEMMTKDEINNKKLQGDSLAGVINQKKKSRDEKSVETPYDGYWVLLQNWTDCSLRCGGGLRFQQWQCVEPKNGGKECIGESVRTKPCNSQPCPTATTILEVTKQVEPLVAKPIIQTGPFSSRFNRYSKCELKETDAFLTSYDVSTESEAKLPIRLVMNNFTISLYGDDTNESLVHSFILEKTNFIRHKDFCCFQVKDNLKMVKLCGFEKTCLDNKKNILADSSESKFVREWEKEFKLFKVDCKVGRETVLISTEDEERLDEDIRKKLNDNKMNAFKKKAKVVKGQILLDNLPGGKNYKLKFSKAQDVSFKAMEKEMSLEKMLQNEEKLKEEDEIGTLMQKIQKEKDKAKCLVSNIQENEIDTMFDLEQRQADKEVIELKSEAVKHIKIKRAALMKKLQDMKNKAKLRKSQLESELNNLRKQMSKNLMRANRIGNLEKCKLGSSDVDKKVDYCDQAFSDDFIQNVDCKKQDDFCYICCENEFGNVHMDNREHCYVMCDLLSKTEKPIKKIESNDNGHFFWNENKN